MSRLFVYIYYWFANHRKSFYAILCILIGLCAVMASQITFQEDILSFFKGSDDRKNELFQNIQAKDKIIIMLSGAEPDEMIAAAEILEADLESLVEDGLISSINAYANDRVVDNYISFVYDYLPIFLTDSDYVLLENTIREEGINQVVGNVYQQMTSLTGLFTADVLLRDPLNIGTHMLQKIQQFNPGMKYELYNGRLFSEDLSTMLMFVLPAHGMGDTGRNNVLVKHLEEEEKKVEMQGVNMEYIGGPIVAVYNARQIKKDTCLTLGLALVIILTVILLSFKNKWVIPLIMVPPAFGALFSLAVVWLIQGEISAIAIGAGTVVLGISLSYSMHFISHLNYIASTEKIIEELTLPLTIGCFTTIGAFAALIFTSSPLLQDMGLFSVFALIGTTLFCLLFLPQFLRRYDSSTKSRLLLKIEQMVGYRYENNKWVLLVIVLVTVVALFFYRKVQFDDNMMNINYMPQKIVEAEERSVEILGDNSGDVYLITGSSELSGVADEYQRLAALLYDFSREGVVNDVVTVCDFLIPMEEQKRRIVLWNQFWDKNRVSTLAQLKKSAHSYGFTENAFKQFEQMICKEYQVCSYSKIEIENVPVISEWINCSDKMTTVLSRISIDNANKGRIYDEINKLENTAIIDRGYFATRMIEATSNDFNYILLVSSLIVFFALFVSYGRIELTLLTFLPMLISWIIILGLMAILDMKFNIVNIILATFIFGIGDDFSIFIMDGLLQEYKNGKKLLGAHKTAIFFSAFTILVGMGVLIFAKHPALKSIALISVLGLAVVVGVAYTVQPMLFRLLVSSQTEKGEFPYTLGSILNTLHCFLWFLIGCIISQLLIVVLILLPIRRKRKKYVIHVVIYYFSRFILKTGVAIKVVKQNPMNETYRKPALIIANHQSFLDILLLLSTTPKIVMLTKDWVWNSPFFGFIVRYADFHSSDEGYETLTRNLKECMDAGYSVVIFPEGTRSVDCSIQRFHKGAFYLAQQLQADILPMIIYGAGLVTSKRQGFYIKAGTIVVKTMERIPYGDTKFGNTYQEQAKKLRNWYREQYTLLNNEFGRVTNVYFKRALIKNYIYKGPVLEWYMRIKCRMDGYYDFWDRLIPSDAVVTDVGCGYGQMVFMLDLLSPQRKIVGVDYDIKKIEIAQHTFLSKKGNVKFVCADMRTFDFPLSDAILFNDSLHYVDANTQNNILTKALVSLKPHGLIVVKDGDAACEAAHRKTEQTELWSTKIIKFNQTSERLVFVDAQWMHDFAVRNGVAIKVHKCDGNSSETLYILTKEGL